MFGNFDMLSLDIFSHSTRINLFSCLETDW